MSGELRLRIVNKDILKDLGKEMNSEDLNEKLV